MRFILLIVGLCIASGLGWEPFDGAMDNIGLVVTYALVMDALNLLVGSREK